MAFEFDLNKVKESLVNAGKEVESMAKDAYKRQYDPSERV